MPNDDIYERLEQTRLRGEHFATFETYKIEMLLKENQRLQQSIADWISGEQGRNLREENQRLRGVVERIGWKMMNHTPMELRAIARQALDESNNK